MVKSTPLALYRKKPSMSNMRSSLLDLSCNNESVEKRTRGTGGPLFIIYGCFGGSARWYLSTPVTELVELQDTTENTLCDLSNRLPSDVNIDETGASSGPKLPSTRSRQRI